MALAVTMAACGSSSSDSGPAVEPGDPSLTGSPIKLMVIAQLTATNQAETPQTVSAAKASASAINARGGIGGRPLQILSCDDKVDANAAAACARKAVSDGAVATVGQVSAMGAAINPVLQQNGMANIGPYPLSASDFSSPSSFPLCAGGPAAIAGVARNLGTNGAETVGLAYFGNAAGATSVPFVTTGLAGTGAKAGPKVPVPPGTADLAPVAAATTKGADAAVLALQPDDAVHFVQVARQSGNTAKLGMPAQDPGLFKKLGGAGDGLYVATQFAPQSSSVPGIKQFLADMEKYARGTRLDDYALNAWLGVQAFEKMLAQQKPATIDTATVKAGMSRLVNLDLGGVVAPYTTTKESEMPGLNRIFGPQVQLGTIKNGQIVTDGKWVNPFLPASGG
ncbi:ABC transporter substrate-binding protein [Streptomyces sp. bgisy027]|uniref:ABC transporter substrate-binding protein n=1 Tax=Streptomyces sp. bgisy027 TaxID=3413770 RepID=UPI003D7255D5